MRYAIEPSIGLVPDPALSCCLPFWEVLSDRDGLIEKDIRLFRVPKQKKKRLTRPGEMREDCESDAIPIPLLSGVIADIMPWLTCSLEPPEPSPAYGRHELIPPNPIRPASLHSAGKANIDEGRKNSMSMRKFSRIMTTGG
jgi:hypothetical protein